MQTTNRLVLPSKRFPGMLHPGEEKDFTLPGHINFPSSEIPLIRGDNHGRPLCGPSANVKVTERVYSGTGQSARTDGKYQVAGVFCSAGSCVPYDFSRAKEKTNNH